MTETNTQASPTPGKGKAFFDRADQVGETGNWDFATELYIEGIRREPGNLERGYKPLRDVSLKRKAKGGKGAGMFEQLKRRPSKDPTESLVNALHLLAKEPGSVAFMEQVLQAAVKLSLAEVVKWVCDVLLETQRQAGKPNKRVLHVITQAYHDIEEFTLAIQACEMGLKMSPDDARLQDTMRNLSAKETIKKGKYGQEGDFTKGVKDLDRQQELIQKDSLLQSNDFLVQQINKSRGEYEASPTVVGKVNAFVDALLKIEDEGYENEAVGVLEKAHKDMGAYQFKMRVGDVKIRQMTRRYRALVERGEKQAAAQHRLEQLKFELEEFTDRAANYPTDLAIKFELGRRQYLAGKLDDAISSLQQAQRDPRRHVHALSILGQAFAKKGWLREATETYERALQSEVPEERAKELRYFLGDVLEKMGEFTRAQEQFSRVAQLDYNYRDVRDRMDEIRKKIGPGG
jgi:tetratricopeptide (TPR) repeat protein